MDFLAKNLIKDHCLHFIKTQNIVYFVQILHSDEYHSHIYIYIYNPRHSLQYTIHLISRKIYPFANRSNMFPPLVTYTMRFSVISPLFFKGRKK